MCKTEIEKNEEKKEADEGEEERPASHLGILLEKKEDGVQGPQYIVGRSYTPTNGAPEPRKVGKFQSKGLKTSFQQSLRRWKHGGAGSRQHQQGGRAGRRGAHPSKAPGE